MNQQELRRKMPQVSAILDELCEAFGKDSIHGQIRRGIRGEPVFYAAENGYEVGTRSIPGNAVLFNPVSQCAMDEADFPACIERQQKMDNSNEILIRRDPGGMRLISDPVAFVRKLNQEGRVVAKEVNSGHSLLLSGCNDKTVQTESGERVEVQ
jgi:hypothetical protein